MPLTKEDLNFVLTIDPDVSKVASAVTSALSQIVGGLGGGQGVGGGAASIFGGIGKAVAALAPEAGPFVEAVMAIVTVIGQAIDTLIGFAAKAAPGVFTQMNLAIDDLQAVIGRSFIPILELLRDSFRFVGDALANILPSASEMREALSEYISALHELWSNIREIVSEFGPIIRMGIIAHFKALAMAMRIVLTPLILFTRAIAAIGKLLGLGGGQYLSSYGAAARPASFRGFEDYSKAIYTAAYSTPGQPTNADVPRTVMDIRGFVEKIASWSDTISPLSIAHAIMRGIATDIHNASASVSHTVFDYSLQPGIAGLGALAGFYNKLKNFFGG